MRASEHHIKQSNQSRAWGAIIVDYHTNDPDVTERFERSPYWPVLNFDKGVVDRESRSRWEED